MNVERPAVEQEWLVGRVWVWGAVALLVLSLLMREAALFLVACLVLCALGASYLWSRRALVGLSYTRSLSRQRAAWGDEVTLSITIDNRKLLPLPWLRIEDEVPSGFETRTRLRASHSPQRRLLRNLLSILWYQRVTRRYHFRCVSRGEHPFGPAELRAGDVFGLSTATLTAPTRDILLVYPKVVPLVALGLPVAQPFGDLRTRQPLFEDPLRTVGIRDYTAGDSLRHMHWKATARLATPQVRIFEPVRTLRVVIFLDVVTGNTEHRTAFLGYDPDLLELAIVVAASTAMHLLGEGFEVGLCTNGRARLRQGLVEVDPSCTPGTGPAILEALARVHPMAAASLDRVIELEALHLPAQASAIVISAASGPDLIAATRRLRGAGGRAVTLIGVGDENRPPLVPGVAVRHVGGERAWRDLPALDLG